ncbi:uncharacterized protein C17orf78 homolog [Sorex araneus]|uniref:uncharacterized protein C17orf78 homolog n=1 Tax=Sorex araneus TaxID=42254 RepID=UPI00243353C8|nr:uncharacterized protein C17orf78 homolog [Sorex araneus]
MDTILVFSLIIASYDANKKELRDSSCQVEQLPRIFTRDGESVRDVPVQEIQADAEGPTSNPHWTVASLQCSGSRGEVKVNLLYSGQRAPGRHALRSLRVFAVPRTRGPDSPTCHLSPASKFHTRSFLGGTAFLPGVSQCKVDSVTGPSTEPLLGTATAGTPGNTDGDTDTDEDLEKRKKWGLVAKSLIAVTLLISGAVIMVFVIFEVPCPGQCRRIAEQCQCQWLWRRLRKGGQSSEAAETQLNPQPEKGSIHSIADVTVATVVIFIL